MHMEALKYLWEGAIPLQIQLHESEVTTLPPPPPALILAPRMGYLPLLSALVKPYFSSALPPGVDTVWFEYHGLPLKWYIPTGVLFDLLCAEPERPWNLTVHFRGYPGNILIPCEGEDSVKWSFINSLKEAAYIINGNSKNVMNMSQSDQLELWNSVMYGSLEAYLRVSYKLKLGTVEDEYTIKMNLSTKSGQGTGETDMAGQMKTGRIPVRLYVWTVNEDFHNLEDAPKIDSWDKISFINRPVEIHSEEGKCFTLGDALKAILPEFFVDLPLIGEELPKLEDENKTNIPSEDASSNRSAEEGVENLCERTKSSSSTTITEIKLVRIQGIEPKLEIPFSWLVNNLMNPEHFLHICICVKVPAGNNV
ncbi:autophagy protein 5 [Mangifera indica]|uniref:autophagy protein 5 n=1 Tax=Mangifera indica TaxID=29780 RepID=UPI001CFAAFF6|nr:autophagy protein 5 [Mangifera indica]XP_044505830.1 autophagy protein 5 [Mangifera indica]